MAIPRQTLSVMCIVGHPITFGVPVLDEDGADKNLDGLTLTSTVSDPAGNNITPTPVQRASGSHLMDITITAAQTTTGGASSAQTPPVNWLVDVFAAGATGGEPLWHGNYQFPAHAAETE